MLDKKEIGSKLRSVRKETRRDRTEEHRITTAANLKNIERGKYYPSVPILRRICTFYDISADWLVGLDQCDWEKDYRVIMRGVNYGPDYEKDINKAIVLYLESYMHGNRNASIERLYKHIVSLPSVSIHKELSDGLLKIVIAERLKLARLSNGYSRKFVAEIIDTTIRRIYNHEKERSMLPLEALYAYSIFYQIPIDYIIGLDG